MKIPHPTVDWRHPHWNRFGVALVLLFVFALAVRLLHLGDKPMHTDEAVQGIKTLKLWTSGAYVYNPEEYHGPTLYYLTLPVLWLQGLVEAGQVTDADLRFVPVIFGAGLVLLLLLTVDGLGRWASLCAAALIGISPMMVFYSRYYIQEMILVFMTYLFIASAWRYTRGSPKAWALPAGLGLGLMHATKETWVLCVAAIIAAMLLTVLWHHWVDKAPLEWRPHWHPHIKLRGVALGAAVAAILFSSLGSNPRGPMDSLGAYTVYLNRGHGAGAAGGGSDNDHVHPAGYYTGRLLWTKYDIHRDEILFWDMLRKPELFKKKSIGPDWSEAFIALLALCGMGAALSRRGLSGTHAAFARFLTFYTVLLALVIELIPYKTPWCALGFWHTTILLAGLGAVAVVKAAKVLPLKIFVLLLLALGTFQLGKQSLAANTRFAADPRNPWVYAHTSQDIFEAVNRVRDLQKISPDGSRMLIKVVTDDPWPLPWYFRGLSRVGYYVETPTDLLAGSPQVIITSDALKESVSAQLPGWQGNDFSQRPNVMMSINIAPGLWQAYLKELEKHDR